MNTAFSHHQGLPEWTKTSAESLLERLSHVAVSSPSVVMGDEELIVEFAVLPLETSGTPMTVSVGHDDIVVEFGDGVFFVFPELIDSDDVLEEAYTLIMEILEERVMVISWWDDNSDTAKSFSGETAKHLTQWVKPPLPTRYDTLRVRSWHGTYNTEIRRPRTVWTLWR